MNMDAVFGGSIHIWYMYMVLSLIPVSHIIHPFGHIEVGMGSDFKNTRKAFFQSRMLVALLCVNLL